MLSSKFPASSLSRHLSSKLFLLLVMLALVAPGCAGEGTSGGNNDAGTDGDIIGDVTEDAGDSDVISDAEADADGSTCTDACPAEGETACHDGGLRTCVRDTPEACLTWSAVEACEDGWVCSDGNTSCTEECGDFCDPFSIVLLPDTQYYTAKQANNSSNSYYKQAQWIVDNRQTDEILFVVHLGDITDHNYTSEWAIASAAHGLLDADDIPYSVTTGNHDYRVNGSGFDRGASLINDYFPPSRFAGKPWYGGALSGNSANNYATFSHGNQKFLVLSIEYAPRKDVLCWANDVVASHPDHHVIVATHCYQTHGGGYSGSCGYPTYDTTGSAAVDVWEEFISFHSNIFLVVAGHIGDSEHRVRQTNTGASVQEMLVDYQFEGQCSGAAPSSCTNNCRTGTYHGNGWMRQLIFDPRQRTVEARTFTVEEGNTTMFPGGQPHFFCSELFDPPSSDQTGGNWYPGDPANAAHQYTFSYNFVSPPGTAIDTLGVTEFNDRTVNSAGAGDQLAPAVAMDASGGSVVVWEDDSDSSDGAGNHDILMRVFTGGGCECVDDQRVNTNPAGQQRNPAVAMDASGNVVVVWEDDADGNGVYQIKARGFWADGTERFAEFTVNSVAAGQQLAPSVAMAPDGRFVVAWQDNGGGEYQILMRGFTADGAQRFADRSVHDDALGERIAPSIGMDDVGNILVAWQDDSDGNGAYQIHARGFAADGSPRVARFTVNSVNTGQQRAPVVGMSGDGRFMVVWRDDPESDGDHDLLARGFNADGTQRFADMAVSNAGGQHSRASVTCDSQAECVVTWADDSDGNGLYQIRAERFAADGSSAQAEWTVNRVPAGQQSAPAAAMNNAGALIIVWEDDMDENGYRQIFARGY